MGKVQSFVCPHFFVSVGQGEADELSGFQNIFSQGIYTLEICEDFSFYTEKSFFFNTTYE